LFYVHQTCVTAAGYCRLKLMTKELEERLAALEKELASTKEQVAASPPKPSRKLRKRPKKLTLAVIFGTLVVVGGLTFFYEIHKDSPVSSPLPSTITKNAGFPLYYPSQLPTGYTYAAGSASNDAGVIFYKVHSDAKEILVIQQPSPTTNLMLDSAVDLDPTNTPNGQAYVGKNKAHPVAILKTKDTLINISGSSDVSSDAINGLLNSLHVINR
jgi:hypothetical protein